MKPTDLLERHASLWNGAVQHPFLEAVREGTLTTDVFAAWLVQDYLFVTNELTFVAHLLPRAPRSDQALLAQSIVSLVEELRWFEEQAEQKKLSLNASPHPVTASYATLLKRLEQQPYVVAISALWAIERAYLEAWTNVAPGHPSYRVYIEHWANAIFAEFVTKLEQSVAVALNASDVDTKLDVEEAFLDVARLEQAFWEMAYSGAKP